MDQKRKTRRFTVKKFIDKQRYSECQLVTAINAAIYLGQSTVDPSSEEYERLVDLSLARCGPAICVERAYTYLRIEKKEFETFPNFEQVAQFLHEGHPIEATIRYPGGGYHSVLIIGTDTKYNPRKKPKRKKYVQVLNFIHTDKEFKIEWHKFRRYWKKGFIDSAGHGYFYLDPLHKDNKFTVYE